MCHFPLDSKASVKRPADCTPVVARVCGHVCLTPACPVLSWPGLAWRAGADCMGLMARAARMAARQGREAITEDDIYAAMENKAMEAFAVSCPVIFLVGFAGFC